MAVNQQHNRQVTIMDTTLRDGEQTHSVSFMPSEKLMIAQRLLEHVGVDRIEVTSARVSPKEQKMLKQMMDWAKPRGHENRIEILSFIDGEKSVDWAKQAGCSRLNMLTKGSRLHCEQQLGKTAEQHLDDIKKTVHYAAKQNMTYSIYLEDWSMGMRHSPDYVFTMLDAYKDMGFERILLPDTLGVLAPWEVKEFIETIIQHYPDQLFEFHGHNDYGLAVANGIAACGAGIHGLHVTVNGLGERTGNTNLAEIVVALNDHTDFQTNVKERSLNSVSNLVERFSGKRVSMNSPVVGKDVFTQTAGIHADGDKKGNLYETKLAPSRFKRDRVYALGKLAGKSSLDMNLDKLGIQLDEQQKVSLLEKIIQYGDQKKSITSEDLPYLIADIFDQSENKVFTVKECIITSSLSLKPVANILVNYQDKTYESMAHGDGGFDAFMNALTKIAPEIELDIPELIDFEVRIPPGGQTDALVETTITWSYQGKTLQSQSVLPDQILSSVKATERIINYIEQHHNDIKGEN